MAKKFGGGISSLKCDFKNRTLAGEPHGDFPAVFQPLDRKLGDYTAAELRAAAAERGVILPERERQAEKLNVNLSETDIGVCLCSLLALTYPDRIVKGALLLMKIYGIGKCVFAVPRSYYREANLINAEMRKNRLLSIVTVADRYPMYDSHTLVLAVAGVEINGGRDLSTTSFMTVTPELCVNLFGVLAAGTAPVKYFSAGGDRLKKAGLMTLSGGMTVKDVRESLGLSLRGAVICGGLVRGRILNEEDEIPGEADGLLFMKREPAETRAYDCVACGKCDGVCPMRLTPSLINELLNRGRNPGRFSPSACIGCGCCSYICPCGEKICEKIQKYNAEKETAND